MTRRADDQHDGDEGRDLGERDDERPGERHEAGACLPLEDGRERGKQHKREDHREVLDDQPADRDAAALGLDQAALLHGAQQHDRAGDRERKPEHDAGADGPAEQPCEPDAERGREAICTTAPGIAMARTESRSSSEKCSPTPNISRITPISASSLASPWSATKPGVNGPIAMPASR